MDIKQMLRNNSYKKLSLLTSNQRNNFYEIANNLQDDLIFLKMLLKRNTKSPFNFEITPCKSCMDYRFWNDIFYKSLSGHTEIEYVKSMLCDYYIVLNFFDKIQGETLDSEITYDNSVLKEIKDHYREMHNMKLEDYIGCFINCSHTCTDVINIMNEL